MTVAALCRAPARQATDAESRSHEAWRPRPSLPKPWVERLSALRLGIVRLPWLTGPCKDEGAAAPEEKGPTPGCWWGGPSHPGGPLAQGLLPSQWAPAHLRQLPVSQMEETHPPTQAASSYLLLPTVQLVPWGPPGLQSLRPTPLFPGVSSRHGPSSPPTTPAPGPPLLCPHPHTSHMTHRPPSDPSLSSPLKPHLGPLTPLL